MLKLSNIETTEGAGQAKPPVAAQAQADAAPAKPKTFAESLAEEENLTLFEMDAAGRRIGVQKLDFLATHKLTMMMGAADAANAVGLQQVMMAAMVVEIDGEAVSRPKTKLEIEALMKRLNFHGIIAAQKAFNRFTSVAPSDGEAAQDDAVKN